MNGVCVVIAAVTTLLIIPTVVYAELYVNEELGISVELPDGYRATEYEEYNVVIQKEGVEEEITIIDECARKHDEKVDFFVVDWCVRTDQECLDGRGNILRNIDPNRDCTEEDVKNRLTYEYAPLVHASSPYIEIKHYGEGVIPSDFSERTERGIINWLSSIVEPHLPANTFTGSSCYIGPIYETDWGYQISIETGPVIMGPGCPPPNSAHNITLDYHLVKSSMLEPPYNSTLYSVEVRTPYNYEYNPEDVELILTTLTLQEHVVPEFPTILLILLISIVAVVFITKKSTRFVYR